MKITLNGKKHELKPLSNLTVAEYMQLAKIQEEKGDNYDPILDPVAMQVGMTFNEIAQNNIDNKTALRIASFLGGIKPLKDFYQEKIEANHFAFGSKMIDKRYVNWQAVGVRNGIQLRTKKTENEIELTVYGLAIMLTKTYDADAIEETYNKLLIMNYEDVLTFAGFFLCNILIFNKHEPNYLRRLMSLVKTSIVRLSKG